MFWGNNCPSSATAFRLTGGIAKLRPTFTALATCLIWLVLWHQPAHADHVHHLWYDNANWQDQDLTALTNGGIAGSNGAIAAFRTTPNNELHVYYVDVNAYHVHQLYFNNTSWRDEDLTSYSGGPQALWNEVSGFAIGNLQYIFYAGIDQHIHELSYNNYKWTDQDITVLGNGPSPLGNYPLAAFPTKPNNQFHVYYPDQNMDLHQMYFNGTSWSDSDLTAITGAQCQDNWAAGFAVGNWQHLFCLGFGRYSNNVDLLHLYYNNYQWLYEDVTFEAGGADIEPGIGVAAFKVPGVNQFEVWGFTLDTHCNRYEHVVNPAKWIDWDLTNLIGAPTEAQYGQIVGFVTTPNNQYHVYYAPSSEVYQIYYNGLVWYVEDLTGGAGNADPNGGIAGFAIGNIQHVFYMSNN